MKDKQKYIFPSFVIGLVFGVLAFVLTFLLGYVPTLEPIEGLALPTFLGSVAFLMGWMLTATMRKSWRVWERIEELEKEVDQCEDPEHLKWLWKEKLVPLGKESFSGQISKLNSIADIMRTKLKYLDHGDSASD